MSQAPRDGVRPSGLRTDIQGMRALAVGVVLVYHVWATALPGGYVGVDVFFVISGFLITSHLVGRPPRTGRDLVDFWARRLRRLLPASLLVLVATLVATRLLAPDTLWDATARQAAGAGLYVVNWWLAADAVDYLAADAAPTAVQHYWSLSVEEQFYLVWPLLVGLLAVAATRWGVRRTHAWAVGLGAVAVASFAWSVHLTATDPGRAYFVTTTRVWELAVGGLLAVAVAIRTERATRTAPVAGEGAPALRAVVAWAGLAAIVGASVTYGADTPFPSWRAALPVLGAAAVIGAYAGTQVWSPGRWLALRPVQWLGDVSYAVYLWHWPLVVLVTVTSAPFGMLDAVGVVVLTLVLAGLTKTYVEDPFRSRTWARRTGATYRLSAVGMAVVLALALLQVWEVDRREAEAERLVAAALASDDPCLGAGALDPDHDCGPADGADGPVVPSPLQAAEDRSAAYAGVDGPRDCWAEQPDFPDVTCTFGEADGAHDVVLLGNSHAGHWLPALQELAGPRDWRITTRLASVCAASRTPQSFDTDARSDACGEWVERQVDDLVADPPDLVVLANRVSAPAVDTAWADSGPAYTDGFVPVLRALADADVPVAVIRDTPAPGDGGRISSVPDCLAAEGERSDACDGPREDWIAFEPAPAEAAAERLDDDDVQVVDLNDHLCDGDTCRAVVGGVVVYFDASHLTATFSRTLAPALDDALADAGLLPG